MEVPRNNQHTSNVEKEKFHEYKWLSLSEMVDKGPSIDDQKHYLKAKPKFTHGQKKISFCDAVKAEGVEFYKQPHQRLTRFFCKASNSEKNSDLQKDDEERDDWMVGLVKNKRCKGTASFGFTKMCHCFSTW